MLGSTVSSLNLKCTQIIKENIKVKKALWTLTKVYFEKRGN